MTTAKDPNPKPARKPLEPLQGAEAVLRVSRVNGRGGDSFLSPEIQKDKIKRWAETNGVRIRKFWDETDSVSGRTTNRVGLKGALKACTDGKSNGLIVAKADRFGRSLPESLTAIYALRHEGKTFVAVDDGMIGGDVTKGPNKMLLTMILGFAELQLEQLTEGWQVIRESCVERGIAMHAPYGYAKDPDKTSETYRQLLVDPDQAEWVTYIFERRAQGASWQVIADELIASEAPTYRDGNRWTHNSVRNVVKNRVYLGELHNGHLVNRAAHRPIVSVELWDRAHLRMKTPSSNRDRTPSLLSGLARCGSCGGRMTLRVAEDKGVTYRSYRCRARFSWGTCPKPANCRADQLDAYAIAQFNADYQSEAIAYEPTVDDGALLVAHDELDEAKADLQDYMSSATMRRVRKDHGREFYDGVLATYVARVDECKAAVAELKVIEHGSVLTADEVGAWPGLDGEARRALLSRAYAAVVVWPGPRQARSTIDRRVHILRANEPQAQNLPGRGVKGSAITPLERPED